MNINLEALNQIPEILEVVAKLKATVEAGTIEKRWLSTEEVADYTPYSKHTIESKVKNNDLVREVHYYKRGGKLCFDRIEIDNWVMGKRSANNSSYQADPLSDITDEILASIA